VWNLDSGGAGAESQVWSSDLLLTRVFGKEVDGEGAKVGWVMSDML